MMFMEQVWVGIFSLHMMPRRRRLGELWGRFCLLRGRRTSPCGTNWWSERKQAVALNTGLRAVAEPHSVAQAPKLRSQCVYLCSAGRPVSFCSATPSSGSNSGLLSQVRAFPLNQDKARFVPLP